MAIAQRSIRPQQVHLAQQGMGRGGPSGLADVLEVLLDKGLVIDAFVRVSLVGIELLTIDARVVVASVDTYLRFAEAVNRLDLLQVNNSQNIGDVFGSSSRSKGQSGSGSRSLGSPGRKSETSRDDDQEQTRQSATEPEGRDKTEEKAQNDGSSSDQGEGGDANEDSDDKGILSRIRERGQVF